MRMPQEVTDDLERNGGEEGLHRRLPKPNFVTMAATTCKALSDPTRILIMYLTAQQPLCVSTIKNITGVPDSKLSYHLSILSRVGLITRRNEGNWVIYSITVRGRRFIDLLSADIDQTSLERWGMPNQFKDKM